MRHPHPFQYAWSQLREVFNRPKALGTICWKSPIAILELLFLFAVALAPYPRAGVKSGGGLIWQFFMSRNHAACPACAMPIGANENLSCAARRAAKMRLQLQQNRIAKPLEKRRHRNGFMMAASLAPKPDVQSARNQPTQPNGRRFYRTHETKPLNTKEQRANRITHPSPSAIVTCIPRLPMANSRQDNAAVAQG